MTVYKYPLDIEDEVDVSLPQGAELLCVGTQGPHVMLWARVDPSRPTVHRHLSVRGTGHPNADGVYVGTVFPGPLVFHIFDRGEVS